MISKEYKYIHGLHQKNSSQQVKGGDSTPLLCSHETPPGVLCSALVLQQKTDKDLLEWDQRRPRGGP